MKVLGDSVGEYDLLFKLILIGDSGVGKTSILMKFSDNAFTESFISTIGVDFKTKYVELDNGKITKLQLWDTAGQERFRTITSSYYRGTNGIILVYDISNQKSFENIQHWCEEIKNAGAKNLPMILVGNKADLLSKRQVSYEEGQSKAKHMNIPFLEISVKTNVDISIIFSTIIDIVIARTMNTVVENNSKNIINKNNIIFKKEQKIKKKNDCC